MVTSPPEIVFPSQAFLGEGPSWDSNRNLLFWVDIFAGIVHGFHPEDRSHFYIPVHKPIGCLSPTSLGNLLVATQAGILRLNPEDGMIEQIAPPESHLPGNRFNDGKCSPEGRFLFGSMDNAEIAKTGSLYSMDSTGSIHVLISNVGISNGLTWSPDQKVFYYIDTPTRVVMAYDYDKETGLIHNPRVAIHIPERFGWPDGMTSDSNGNLWIAMWGGAAITVWKPGTGDLITSIQIPAKNVTSCAFGGKSLNELFITSARKGLDHQTLDQFPATGSLFKITTNVAGSPTFQYHGINA